MAKIYTSCAKSSLWHLLCVICYLLMGWYLRHPLLLIYLSQSRMFLSRLVVFLNPDSANDHCLIFSAVVMSCSSHYKEYQETVAPGEMRKRPCLSWAEPILVITAQPCTWPQWHAKYTHIGTLPKHTHTNLLHSHKTSQYIQ